MSKILSKRVVGASVVAASALLATGAAFATGVVAPNATSPTLYALENILATTKITAPPVVYTMGVGRSGTGQDITVLYTLPTGVTFDVAPPLPLVSAPGTASVALKRGGAGTNQVVYSITMGGTAMVAGATISLGGVVLDGHGLQVLGNNVTMQVEVLDQVETACVDNIGTPGTCYVTSNLVQSAVASDFWNTTGNGTNGVKGDTGTTTDVNAKVPLAGFVPGGVPVADTPTVATALVQVKNTIAGVRNALDTADYTLVAADLVTVTITDPTGFLGLAPFVKGAGGLWWGIDNKAQGAANTFTVSGNTATLASIPGSSAGMNLDETVSYTSDATTPMGTTRVLSIAGSVAPTSGTGHAYTGNTSWWTWGSNGTVLETPWFTTYSGYISRFAFMNYGTNDVTYSVQCLAESGNTITAMPIPTGSNTGKLLHGQQTVVTATDVCSFSGNTRGAVRFTINAPNTVVKGVYNVVNASSGSVSVTDLWRPGSN